jgi:hypothetical protein
MEPAVSGGTGFARKEMESIRRAARRIGRQNRNILLTIMESYCIDEDFVQRTPSFDQIWRRERRLERLADGAFALLNACFGRRCF